MSADIVQVNISQEIIASLGDIFNPLFNQIRIYGTIDEPLFVAKDVEKALEISDLHIRDRPNFKEGLHYVIKTAPTRGGPQRTVMMTEFGLYQAMFCSEVPIAEQYCRFIVIVMKQLRTKGSVTITSSMKELKEENEKLKSKVEMLDRETDRLHEELMEAEAAKSQKAAHIARLENRAYESRQAAELAESRADRDLANYVDRLEQTYLKKVYAHIAGDDDDIPENDVYVFRLSTKPALARHQQVAELMMVNPQKQIATMGADLECTLTELRDMIYDSNMKLLQ